MESIKSKLIAILIIAAFIIVPTSLLANFTNWFLDAIKWIIFIDNAEIGLPYWSEVFIKGAIEVIILGFAAVSGISNKNPFISILVIVLGFIACIIIYWIAEYIVWIMIALLLLATAYSIYLIITKNKNSENQKEGETQNDFK